MNSNRFMSSSNAQATQIDLGLRSYMLGVYNHMTTALALTGLMALGLNFLAISNGALTPIGELFFLSPLKWVIMLAPLGMVFYISARINSISSGKARNLFYIYAGLMGLSLSSLLLIYTGASVVRAFFCYCSSFCGFIYIRIYYKKIPFRLRIFFNDGCVWSYYCTNSKYIHGIYAVRLYDFNHRCFNICRSYSL
jgi:FtsH-binding integral membrane protein